MAGRGMQMPDVLPDALEAGTINAVGFAGLLAGMQHSMPNRHAREVEMTRKLLDGLCSLPGVCVQGRPDTEGRTAVVLFTIDGWHPREAAMLLDEQHGICIRGGTHCAPLLHEALGNGEHGALRVSPGWATTEYEIDRMLACVEMLAAGKTDSPAASLRHHHHG